MLVYQRVTHYAPKNPTSTVFSGNHPASSGVGPWLPQSAGTEPVLECPGEPSLRGDGAIANALADLNFKNSEIAHLAPRLQGI